jgi:hypothetical protein
MTLSLILWLIRLNCIVFLLTAHIAVANLSVLRYTSLGNSQVNPAGSDLFTSYGELNDFA